VFEQLKADGFIVKAGFHRHDSVENWGPPEERERCVWYIVHDGDGTPLGTMILQVYPSHRTFHFPRAPRLLALDAVDREAILAALANASTRVRRDLKDERLPAPDRAPASGTRWEYATDVALADSLHAAEGGQFSNWLPDEALSHWGRYGWELVSVTPLPAGNRVVAFFKRACTM
jgi:hypothetical protein